MTEKCVNTGNWIEMWQQVALKLMALGTAQEQKG